MASTPVEDAEPVAPMTTLEAAVLEATGTEPAAVAPAPVAAPPVAPAAPPPAPKGRVAQKRTENWSDLALPFAGRPALLNRELAADAGFDPLSLADSKVQFYVYREAELKHARLAMLAAAGWPLAELWDTGIAKTFGLEPIIEENGGRAVSVLNGGMGKISPVYWVSVVAFAAAVEALSEYKKGQAKAADSSGCSPVLRPGRPRLRPARALHDLRQERVGQDAHGDGGDQEREIGYVGVTIYALEEAITKNPVVQNSAFLFERSEDSPAPSSIDATPARWRAGALEPGGRVRPKS